MKRLICSLVLSSLIYAGLVVPSSGNHDRTAPAAPIGEVLRAHNVPQDRKALLEFAAEAVKLTSYQTDSDSRSHGFFERKVKVSYGVNGFKRQKVDPMGLRQQTVLFDGQEGYQTVVERGATAGEVNPLSDSQLRTVAFSLNTFGLVPVLSRLSDPEADVVYAGRTPGNEYTFELKMADRIWRIYTDRWHVIRKVEVGAASMEYADYRSVDGVLLPFIQRAYLQDRLIYELVFSNIDLKPAFPPDYFSREAPSGLTLR